MGRTPLLLGFGDGVALPLETISHWSPPVTTLSSLAAPLPPFDAVNMAQPESSRGSASSTSQRPGGVLPGVRTDSLTFTQDPSAPRRRMLGP
nr:hypothetical protein GCM10020092_027580 [Actinoplanes digitatis]